MPISNAGKFPARGKAVDGIDHEMTQRIYDEFHKIGKMQDEHGRGLARHGTALEKIDGTVARYTSILQRHTTELGGLGSRFEQLETTIGQLKDTVVGMDRDLRAVRTMLASNEMLFHAWGQRIDDTQNTVDEMEAKVDLIVRHLGIIKE